MSLFPPAPMEPGSNTPFTLNINPENAPSKTAISAQELQRAKELSTRLHAAFSRNIIGQENLRDILIVTLVAGGHVLIESVPGLAKTTAARTLANCVSGTFKRIQCTPDLMPSDIIGTQIFDFASQKLITQIGPVHANFVLLDEINRSSAKTQSAMLEAMAEGSTTIGGEAIALPDPFMVIATQNPIEEEGTYSLPEAQMDRFYVKAVMDYPTPQEETRMLGLLTTRGSDTIKTNDKADQIPLSDIAFLRKNARRIHVSDQVMNYTVDIVDTSRGGGSHPLRGLSSLIRLGGSPRASIALIRIGQAVALMNGRDFVIPEDIKAYVHEVLRHRILLTFEAIADNINPDEIIDQILEVVPAP